MAAVAPEEPGALPEAAAGIREAVESEEAMTDASDPRAPIIRGDDPPEQHPPELVLKCGQCHWGRVKSKNLNDPLECRRFPPTLAQIPITPTQVWRSSGYPQVTRQNPACGEFKARMQS